MAHQNGINRLRATARSQGIRNGEPPPSLNIGVHIAPHLTSGPSREYGIDRETFSQLHREILGQGDDAPNLDEDIKDIYNLVCVVLKAGIEPCLDLRNASARREDLVGQILDCLDILRVAIEKYPAVLYESSGSQMLSQNVPSLPLYVWLISPLLLLLCSWDEKTMVDKVCLVISTMFKAHFTSPQLFYSVKPFSRLLQACIAELLYVIEDVDIWQADDMSSMSLAFPVPSNQFLSCLDSLEIPLSVLKSASMGSPQAVAKTCLRLIEAVTCPFDLSSPDSRAPFLRENFVHGIHSLGRLWKVVFDWFEGDTDPNEESFLTGLFAEFVSFSRKSCSFSVRLSARVDQSVIQPLFQSGIDMLASTKLNQSSSLQLVFSEFLVAVAWLTQSFPGLDQIFDELFLSSLSDLKSDSHVFGSFHQSLQVSIVRMLNGDHRPKSTSKSLCRIGLTDYHSPQEINRDVKYTKNASTIEHPEAVAEQRAPKQPRLSDAVDVSNKPSISQTIANEVFHTLGTVPPNGFEELDADVIYEFCELSSLDQCSILANLGRLACAWAENLAVEEPTSSSGRLFCCTICDGGDQKGVMKHQRSNIQFSNLRQLITNILPRIHESGVCRIASMLAIRKILLHDPNENDRVDLTSFGLFCLQSLQSSIRELRIAAGATAAAFLNKGLHENVRRSNAVVILDRLQTLSKLNKQHIQESCIMALRRIAEYVDHSFSGLEKRLLKEKIFRTSGDEEMNIILLQFLEYLGHTNPFISQLAANLKVHPGVLFRPFWRTLSVLVVKNLESRPQIADQLLELIGLDMNDFLRITAPHILPHLVLLRKKQLIERVAKIQGLKNDHEDLTTVSGFVKVRPNLGVILALLLVQPFPDPEKAILSIFRELSVDLNGLSLEMLVRSESVQIMSELLRGLGESGEKNGSRFYNAAQYIASVTPRQEDSDTDSSETDPLLIYIEEHVLGIVTEFSHGTTELQLRQPLPEKKRNIVALQCMIRLAKGRISIALRQICGCLRSALEMKELRDTAFSTWNTMMLSLSPVDIEPLIGQTFALILKYWSTLNETSRDTASELIDHILNHHNDIISTIFATLPSLVSVPELSKHERVIAQLKSEMDARDELLALCQRCQNEDSAVVERALIELSSKLVTHEKLVHSTVRTEQPEQNIAALLTRALLDCCIRQSENAESIMASCAQCLGLIGCLDFNRVESIKEKKNIVVLSNFENGGETFEFILFILQNVLVEAYLSGPTSWAQGFLSYAMQALLGFCKLSDAVPPRPEDPESGDLYRRWLELPKITRNTLTPFLKSKYSVTIGTGRTSCEYPLFKPGMSHKMWLRTFVLDMLQKGKEPLIASVFSVCSRIIRTQDISISTFLMPFAALNLAVSDEEEQREQLKGELSNIFQCPLPENDGPERSNLILCSESAFTILDYISRWLQAKKKENTVLTANGHGGWSLKKAVAISTTQIKRVEQFLSCIPAEKISSRAVECKSYARALFHWEQYIRQQRLRTETDPLQLESLYQKLQDIYTQIDEPDGIEGISSLFQVLDLDQRIVEQRNTGRWTTAQSWYELQLNNTPADIDAQAQSLQITESALPKILPYVIEASWVTHKWDVLESYLSKGPPELLSDFNVGIGFGLAAFRRGDLEEMKKVVGKLRLNIVKKFNSNSISSFQASHDSVLKFHVLAEVEMLASTDKIGRPNNDREQLFHALDRRLGTLGDCISDKLYLLGVRQAVMNLSPAFDDLDAASVWQQIARIARKSNYTDQAFNAILRATQLNDKSSTIEYARLLWKEGDHRSAIKALESAISANSFTSGDLTTADIATSSLSTNNQPNILLAKAHLLLAKWMDGSGQTQSEIIIQRYREAISYHSKWEKAHYYLGRHYAKILDSEKSKPLGKEGQKFLSGEASKLVIYSYLRSLVYGSKYVFQTLPKVLTLWLEHAATVGQPFDPKRGNNEEFQKHNMAQRKKNLDDIHSQLKKYISRISPALLYTALPQVVARICQQNVTVYNTLTQIIVKIVVAFPQQALWTVLAVLKSSSMDRASRGAAIVQKITPSVRRVKSDLSSHDIRLIINQGQKFSEELAKLCLTSIKDKPSNLSNVSLESDFKFNHRSAPCKLVVPIEAALTPAMPPIHESNFLKNFRAFPEDAITIEAVLDQAIVLRSLQQPRRINIRGSDGKVYGILCKPKDDLRKDQRLMEYNTMINRLLKRDPESNKRKLYIRTYAVTPLSEDCGLIQWVESNLKTLRGLLLKLYKEKGIPLNGLTFETPELVPFRLTHNMVDAFGPYGYEGPFRKTCELTLILLRQHEDTLMTILETFLHDPTTDLINRKTRVTNPRAPHTPEGVLELVRTKLSGILPGESVPLSIGGHVEELILQATKIKYLAAMYIGWCAFL
ncbi:serine/threonine-protein kinase M1 [Myotisia sp. PD_48]|nr:serine/threonine-protein kinase M1 [Myotisia sp. PD_48]